MSNEKMELTKEDVEQMIEVGVKKKLEPIVSVLQDLCQASFWENERFPLTGNNPSLKCKALDRVITAKDKLIPILEEYGIDVLPTFRAIKKMEN